MSGPAYKKLASNAQFYKIGQKDIESLHLSRSLPQFIMLGKLLFEKWMALAEPRVARAFKREYLTEPYQYWFVTASNIPGVMPDNNPAESCHKQWKSNLGMQLFSTITLLCTTQFVYNLL